jgi:hypothetical protein
MQNLLKFSKLKLLTNEEWEYLKKFIQLKQDHLTLFVDELKYPQIATKGKSNESIIPIIEPNWNKFVFCKIVKDLGSVTLKPKIPNLNNMINKTTTKNNTNKQKNSIKNDNLNNNDKESSDSDNSDNDDEESSDSDNEEEEGEEESDEEDSIELELKKDAICVLQYKMVRPFVLENKIILI